jgi:hypothetical protein
VSRLTVKVALLIEAVLVLGFGASTVWTLERERAVLLEQNRMAARTSPGRSSKSSGPRPATS